MSRYRLPLLAAAAFAALGATAAAAYDEGLVRIEPRPYYGAVVTVEQGVRVYRPLPSQSLMIINPNRTPISLSFSRTIEHRAADGGGNGGSDGDSGLRNGGVYGLGGFVGSDRHFRGQHHGHRHRISGVGAGHSAKHLVRKHSRH